MIGRIVKIYLNYTTQNVEIATFCVDAIEKCRKNTFVLASTQNVENWLFSAVYVDMINIDVSMINIDAKCGNAEKFSICICGCIMSLKIEERERKERERERQRERERERERETFFFVTVICATVRIRQISELCLLSPRLNFSE